MPGLARFRVKLACCICVAAAFSATFSCAGPQKAPLPIPDDNGGPLSNVILLPLTTRATDGLLGHAWDVETDLADPLRLVLNGAVTVTSTDQHVMFFRDTAARAELDATIGIANAGVWASRVTHVLYDVQITSLATLATGTQRYNAESGCCLQGNPTESCTSGYVYRLMRGSGTIRLLQRIEGEISANFKEVLMARGGAKYRVVDESTFSDAYFGLELSPLQSVCRTLTPEQELAPLKLLASPNCTINRFGALGEKESLARQLPSEELCLNVAKRYCSELAGAIACRTRFGTADEVDLVMAATRTPEPASAKAAPPNRSSKKPPKPVRTPAGSDTAVKADTAPAASPLK